MRDVPTTRLAMNVHCEYVKDRRPQHNMWRWWALLFIAHTASAQIAPVSVALGSYVVTILRDTSKPFPGRTAHVSTEGNTLYLVDLDELVTDDAVCRQSVTKQIPVNPRGCDAKNIKDAIDDFYCEFGGDLAIREAQNAMREQWTLRPDSPLCTDPSACLGDVYLPSETWKPGDPITDEELLKSRKGVFVVSAGGPTGEIPMITYIPIEMPKLNITGTCENADGLYSLTSTDNALSGYYNVTYAFEKLYTFTSRRLNLVREGRAFRVELAVLSSPDYEVVYVSNTTYTSPIDILGEVSFGSCSMRVELIQAPKPLKMIEPQLQDDLTYYHDWRGKGFVTMELGYRRGAYDHLGRWVYPDCPPGALCGGYVLFQSPGPFGVKYRVEPDLRFKDFVWSCVKLYPRNTTFLGYADFSTTRATYHREAPDENACNAPFPHPDAIQAKRDDPEEKMRQCKMLGGYPALLTQEHCTIDVTTTLCRQGWYFFDEVCYYVPDPDKDASLMSSQTDADAACAALHPKAKQTTGREASAYLEAWLTTFYTFYAPTNIVRVFLEGRRCKCYTVENDEGVVNECNCETPMYPACRYLIKDDYISWNDMKYHPRTLQIMRDGQCVETSDDDECLGLERYGRELEFVCLPGSGGPFCQTRVCILNAAQITEGGLLVEFARKCEAHGMCFEGMPDTCHCVPGYGPPSTLGMDAHMPHMCAAPSTFRPLDPDAGYTIDNTTYFDGHGVCNGRSAGKAVCDKATGECVCECATRTNMDPLSSGVESAFDGVQCAARRAMRPPGSYQVNGGIVEPMCNGRGTVCPSGERLDEKRLDASIVTTPFRDECLPDKDGCVCPPGWIGEACTGPVPASVGIRTAVTAYQTHVTLRSRLQVKNVYVRPKNAYAGVEGVCTPINVTVGDSPDLSNQPCVKTEDDDRWWCDSYWGSFVTVRTLELEPSCEVEAMDEDHLPCGNHTDSRMARFYANEVYRGWGQYDEPISQEFGQFGVTTTECAPDANHTGKLTRNVVTSMRADIDGKVTVRACGEGTNPPRGLPTDDGCACKWIAGFDFTKSPSCTCAWFDGLGMCGGVGRCMEPSHPYGTCQFDLDSELDDDLSTPFAVATDDLLPLYTFHDMPNGQASIVSILGESWRMPEGHVVGLQTIAGGDVGTCYANSRFRANLTHECGASKTKPARVKALVELRVNELLLCEEEEDPSCWQVVRYNRTCDPASASSCATPIFCNGRDPQWNETMCIEVQQWVDDEDDERVLVSGRYEDVWFVCANATTTSTTQEFPYGRITECANPVLRWIDDALWGGGYQKEPQCKGGIVSHSYVKGEIYGVFSNAIPGLDFEKEWTDDHYAFVGAVTNDRVCRDVRGRPMFNVLRDKIMDRFALDLVAELGPELTANWTGHVVKRTNTTNVDHAGSFGSDLSLAEGVESWPTPVPEDSFYETWRPGMWTTMPANARRFKITPSAPLAGMQIFGPHGRVCVSILREIQANETIVVDCRDAMMSESVTDVAARVLSYANRTEMMDSYVAPLGRMWTLPLDAHPDSMSNVTFAIEYTYRNQSANAYWAELAAAILIKRVFPRNRAFERECVRRGGSLSPIEMRDRPFLYHQHAVHLARRRCTHDWQCQRFARGSKNYKCVPDTTSVASMQWANGDPAFLENVFGFEGGCMMDFANEIMDPQFSGLKCVAGYDATWASVVAFERAVRADFPNATHVLVDLTEEWTDRRTKCTLPSLASSGRPTDACNGARGWLSRTYYEVGRRLTVWSDNKQKRCESLRVDSSQTWIAEDEDTELDVHTFYGPFGLTANVVRGVMYVNGEEWAQTDVCDGDECVFGGHTVKCNQRTDDALFRVRTFLNDAPIVTRRRDFWTSYLFI